MGEWQAAPRGGVDVNEYGYYSDIKGYSFEFDHYKNTSLEPSEYNHLVRLEDWVHLPGATINQTSDATADTFTLKWNYDGNGTFTNTTTYSSSGVEKYEDAYFGIGTGTGGQTASHDVRSIILTGFAALNAA